MAVSLAGELHPSPTLSTSTTHAGILSLPREVISVVVSYCDKPSALALVRVCRRFASLDIEQQLWHHLSLTTHDLPFNAISSAQEANEAEEASLSRLIWKVGEIAERADEGRCGMVRCIEMVPRPGALGGIVDLLGRISGTLESLALVSPNLPTSPLPPTSFDSVLLDTDITFPALEKLVIGDNTTYISGFIPYLCSLAPHLRTLIVHVHKAVQRPSFASPSSHPHIKQLQIGCNNRNEKDYVETTTLVLSLLRHLPNLGQVSIDFLLHADHRSGRSFRSSDRDGDYCSSDADDVEEYSKYNLRTQAIQAITGHLSELENVEDLDWCGVGSWDFHRAIPSETSFLKLRRLVLGPVNWKLWINADLNLLPALQAIFSNGIRSSSHAHTSLTLAQMRKLISGLRRSPRLRLLHVLNPHTLQPGLDIFYQLDDIEASENPNGVISSYHHGEASIVHVRLLVQSPSVIRDYADYNGLIVPSDKLGRMRLVDGRTEGEWRARGVEVGDEGWEVLMAWERELTA